MTPADRYRHRVTVFDHIVRSVPPDRWSVSSPCEAWTAADVVRHVADTSAQLLDRMGFPGPSAADPATDPVAGWHAARAAMQDALDDPACAGHAYDGWFGSTTFAETVDRFYATDLTVHGWDLARAVGLRELEPIDGGEIALIRVHFAGLGDSLRMPGICGPEVPVDDDADDTERLVAWLGRDPRWGPSS